MCGHVRVEIGGVPEGLVAHGALVGRGRAVRRLVLLQVGLLPEPLVADGALERPLARVDLLVGRQVRLGREVLAAGPADVLGLPGVHVLHVRLQAGQVAEFLLAEGAVEWLAGVGGRGRGHRGGRGGGRRWRRGR